MLYQNILNQYCSSDYGYKEFRELYQHVRYFLEIEGIFASDEGKETSLYHALMRLWFEEASIELSSLHQDDDEYGTVFHCGKSMSYHDCAQRLLVFLYASWHVVVDCVIYDGEINSVNLLGFNDDWLDTKYIKSPLCDEDGDELPF